VHSQEDAALAAEIMSRINKSRFRKRTRSQQHTRQLALESLEGRLLLYNAIGSAWNVLDLSYSFVPDGADWDTRWGGGPSVLFEKLDAICPTEVWQQEIARALQTWANHSNLNFHRVDDDGATFGSPGDAARGDIRIGSTPATRGTAYAYYPGGGTGGDVNLNSAPGLLTPMYWTAHGIYELLRHEFGHSLGLGHSFGTESVMGPHGRIDDLPVDDIAGIQALYGARRPDAFDAVAANDGFGSASALVIGGEGTNFRADLTSHADVDYYRMSVPGGAARMRVAVDARKLSLLAPKVAVYDSAQKLVATASGKYGTVAEVEFAVTPGQSYYIVADGATTDEFGMGAYRMDVDFGLDKTSQTSETLPPNFVTPPIVPSNTGQNTNSNAATPSPATSNPTPPSSGNPTRAESEPQANIPTNAGNITRPSPGDALAGTGATQPTSTPENAQPTNAPNVTHPTTLTIRLKRRTPVTPVVTPPTPPPPVQDNVPTTPESTTPPTGNSSTDNTVSPLIQETPVTNPPSTPGPVPNVVPPGPVQTDNPTPAPNQTNQPGSSPGSSTDAGSTPVAPVINPGPVVDSGASVRPADDASTRSITSSASPPTGQLAENTPRPTAPAATPTPVVTVRLRRWGAVAPQTPADTPSATHPNAGEQGQQNQSAATNQQDAPAGGTQPTAGTSNPLAPTGNPSNGDNASSGSTTPNPTPPAPTSTASATRRLRAVITASTSASVPTPTTGQNTPVQPVATAASRPSTGSRTLLTTAQSSWPDMVDEVMTLISGECTGGC